jgi:hypothetical protein
LDQDIYRSDTFWKLKNIKNIETMKLLNTRPMNVALHYFKKVFGPTHLSKRYILKIKEC